MRGVESEECGKCGVFDLLKRTHSAKRQKSHGKNHKPVYMLWK